jgi:hypothetical protein
MKIRVRITSSEDGVEILGDSMFVHELERLLSSLGADDIDLVLCG